HAVFDRRSAQDVGARREIVGQPLDDDRVASQRQMGAVLLAGADRHQEAGIALQDEADVVGRQRLQVTRRLHIVLAGCATALAVTEWLHGNAGVWAWTAGAAGGQAPGVERGVVILGADGEPFAWAGRHRVVPARDTVELRAVITPFYVSLEARRQTQAGGTAVGSVLIDAAPAARDREGPGAALFARRYGVTLRFYTPHLAP